MLPAVSSHLFLALAESDPTGEVFKGAKPGENNSFRFLSVIFLAA